MVLCDTNILIALFKGDLVLRNQLSQIGQNQIIISDVTCAELIYGVLNKNELNQLLKYLNKLQNIPINQVISAKSIELLTKYSLSHKLNLPDALIAQHYIMSYRFIP